MLEFVTFPMWPSRSRFVTLQEVLRRLPANDLLWRILWLEATGEAPGGLTMPAFEELVRASPDGYHLTWAALSALASRIDQVVDGLVVASKPEAPLQRAALMENCFAGCDYVIEAFDSTEWRVGAKDGTVLAQLRKAVAASGRPLTQSALPAEAPQRGPAEPLV